MSTTTTTNITTWIAQTTCTTRGCCGPAIQVSSGTNTTVLERADASDDNGRSTAAVSTRVVPAPTSLVIQELFQTVLHIPSNLSQLISAIWLHFSDQPKKPLWNIQQTVVMAFLQAFRDHSLTNSLEFWRLMLIFPTWLTPLTSKIQDGSFRVRPRNLRGILRQADKDEKAGTRVLEAEWMSAGTVWDRCQSIFSGKKKLEDFDLKEQEQILDICKHRNQGATALVLRARSPEKIVLYLHGGAYCAMSAQSHRTLTHKISKATDRRVFAINYRLAPETRFPGALYDAVQAYLHLIDNKDDGCSFEPGNILIMGDSAGGGLSLALMLYIRDHGLPQPEGAVLLSPWVDLTFSYPSWKEASVYDYLPSNPGLLKAMNPAYLYIGPNQPEEMVRHPYVSPIFAENFENLPPILIQSGGCESLRDEIQDLTEKIGATRTSLVHHEVYQDMVHVFQAFPFAKSAEAIESIGWWAKFGIPMIAQWQARGQLPSPSSSFAQQQQPSVPISRSQGRRFHSIPG